MHTWQHRQHTLLGLILIALIGILAGCNFSNNETIEPAAANDLRVTPYSTAWTPAATLTQVPSATPDTESDDQTASSAASESSTVQTTGNQTYSNAPSVNTGSSSTTINPGFVVNTSPPAPGCGLVPSGGYNVNIRAWPNLSATILGTLTQGSWVYAQFAGDGWYQVDYDGTPVDGGWIYADVVSLTQPCTCTPDCANIPPPTPVQACTVTNYMAQGVASAPYGEGLPVTQLGPHTTSYAVSRLPDGTHYRIQTPAGTGWISVVSNVTLAGQCDSLPVEPWTPPEECHIRINQAVDMLPRPGWGERVTVLNAGTTVMALGRTPAGDFYKVNTQAGNGWVHVGHSVTLTGNCDAVPVEPVAPPPDSDSLPFVSSVYRFAFDFPANWYVQETARQAIVTSYDPAYGDPAHAAFADPALVRITINARAFEGDHAAWVAQFMEQVNGETLSVFDQQTIALPGGLQGERLEMVGGTGGFPVLLAVINGQGVTAEGMMANSANFDRVVGTLRAAP